MLAAAVWNQRGFASGFALVVILLECSVGSNAFALCTAPLGTKSWYPQAASLNSLGATTKRASPRMCEDDTTPMKERKFDPLREIKDMLTNLDGVVDDVRMCVCVRVGAP